MTKSIVRHLDINGVEIRVESYAGGNIVMVLGRGILAMTTETCAELSEALTAAVDAVADLTDSSVRTTET